MGNAGFGGSHLQIRGFMHFLLVGGGALVAGEDVLFPAVRTQEELLDLPYLFIRLRFHRLEQLLL